MPTIEYVEKDFKAATLKVIDEANEIIDSYLAQGMSLTLRQLYYRFVATGLIPNTQKDYKRLGSIVNDGRLAGLIDWEAIEDRGRSLNRMSHWDHPADIIEGAAVSYAIDKWEGQEFHVEVWVEKQALEAVILKAAQPLDVNCFACKGYTSQSEMWRASLRFKRYAEIGQTPVIIHLGDHDPSGIDMTRDIADRLDMFGVPMEVNRIALNMDQVEEHTPPPNPAKLSDSRAQGYIQNYGYDSWELDALEPAAMHELITAAIEDYCDMKLWKKREKRQEKERELLTRVSDDWDDVCDYLAEN